MVKAIADINRDHVNVEAEGTAANVMAEATAIVREVYLAIKEQDFELAEKFRCKFIELATRTDSPIWRDEEEEEEGA